MRNARFIVTSLSGVLLLMASDANSAVIQSGGVFASDSNGLIIDLGTSGDLSGGDLRIGFGTSNGALEINANSTPNTITQITDADDILISTESATGSLRVIGDGSAGSASVEVRDDLRLGANADSSLTIENGGQVIRTAPTSGRAGSVIIGSYADFQPGTGNTTTTITGPSSYLEINGRLELGFNNGLGSDDMTISNGSRVVVKEPDDFATRAAATNDPGESVSGDVSIGGDFEFGANQALDTLTITGSDSELVYSSGFFTNSGNNRIFVTDGGAIRQNETGDIEAAAAFYGLDPDDFGVSLGSGLGESSLLVDGAGSTVSATRNVSIGSGDVFIGFDNGDFTKPLFGPSTADVTVITGGLLSTPKDIVVSKKDESGTGFLTVGSGGRAEADNVFVQDGGVLSGNGGTVAADVTLDGGRLSPGASPGTMNIIGDLIATDGILELEIDSTGMDILNVSGQVVLGMDLAIDFFIDTLVTSPMAIEDFFTGYSTFTVLPGFDPLSSILLIAGTNSGYLPGDLLAVSLEGQEYALAFTGASAPVPNALFLVALGLGILSARRLLQA